MKRKQLIAGIISAALSAVTLFCGCARSDGTLILMDANKGVTEATRISFYGYKYNESDLIAIENSIHKFMAIHPEINVNYEGIRNEDRKVKDDYYNIFDLRYASGHLDDVFMVKKKDLDKMQAAGDLEDISDFLNVEAFNDLVKSQIKNSDGSVYVAPMALTSYCLYINYDALDGQPVPENLSQFAKVCDDYVKKYNQAPIICNNNRSLRTLAQAYGTYSLYQREDCAEIIAGYNQNPLPLVDDYLKSGVEFVKRAIDSGWIDCDKTKDTKQTDAESGDMYQFIQGKQPFMITGSWATNRITETEQGKHMNYGVHALPLLESGSVLVYDIDVCMAVNAHSPNRKEAETFISFFSNPESVWDYCNGNNSFSPLKDETRLPDNKTLAPHIPYYTNGQSVLGTDFRLNYDISKPLKEALDMLLYGNTVDAAVSYLKAQLKLLAAGDEQ